MRGSGCRPVPLRQLSRRSGCVPAEPYPPLSHGHHAPQPCRRTTILHRTALTPLTSCLTPGVHFIGESDTRCFLWGDAECRQADAPPFTELHPAPAFTNQSKASLYWGICEMARLFKRTRTLAPSRRMSRFLFATAVGESVPVLVNARFYALCSTILVILLGLFRKSAQHSTASCR